MSDSGAQLGSVTRHDDDGWHTIIEITVARAGANGLNPDFRGVRVGPLSRRHGGLKLAVVLPDQATGSPDRLMREALAQAVDGAERFAERKGLASKVAGARRAVRELPPPAAGRVPTPPEATVGPPSFTRGFLGYDAGQVDLVISQGRHALLLASQAVTASTLAMIRGRRFRTRVRGYNRQQVDGYLNLLEEALHSDPR